MPFIETLYNVHYDHRRKAATVHRSSCPHGHHKNDSRGRWETRVPSSQVAGRIRATGYARKYCSKCGS